MKVVIADTGAIISLIYIDKLDILDAVIGNFYIALAVWEELNNYENNDFPKYLIKSLENKVCKIKSKNHLTMVMDYGESESILLYEELKADYLLIDDNKARMLAESLNINCIGTLGVLIKAKQNKMITELKPLFEILLTKGRYYSKKLLNKILIETKEQTID